MNEIEKARNRYAIKSNFLIDSKFSLSAQQMKIMTYIISMIEKDDGYNKRYEFSVDTFCKISELENDNATKKHILDNLQRLSDKSLWLPISEDELALVRWIEQPIFNKKTNTYSIELNKYLKPYLIHLKENFTKVQVKTTLSLRSKYAIRLYEILLSWKYRGTVELSIDKLRELTNTENIYSLYGNWKKRVLEPAIDELVTSELDITYQEIKKARKVISIRFHIKDNDFIYAGQFHRKKRIDKKRYE